MQNFIANSMRRFGLAPKNKVTPKTPQTGKMDSATNAPLGHMEIQGDYSYSTLSYPLDLQSRSDLGHYIMFYVNIPTTSGYSQFNSTSKKGKNEHGLQHKRKIENLPQAQKELLTGSVRAREDKAGEFSANGKSWKPGHTDKVVPQRAHKGNLPRLTKRTADAIVLYMPNTGIASQHTPQWSPSEMGGDVGEAAGRILQGAGGWGSVAGFAGQFATKLKNAGLAIADAAAGGDVKSTVDKVQNKAENKFLEMFFKGVDMRKYSFQWQFRPKSPEEAYEVYKIIEKFKFHALPEFPDDNRHGRYFTPPATFDIFYMFRGDENQWINKIAECVIGGVNVNYSPSAWQTFRPIEQEGYPQGAPPTEIDLQLDFMETRVITKEDILEGF